MRTYVSMGVVIAFIAGLMVSGCASGKGPAEEAIKAAEQAVQGAKEEAMKVVPDQIQSLEAALNSAKDKFAKKDYKAALTEAQAIPGKVKEVLEAAKSKKEQLTKAWTNLSQSLPKIMDSIKKKIDTLSKSKKLPKDIPAQKFAEAKTMFSEAMKEWGLSQESFKAGNLSEAVTKANTVKEKAAQILQTLKIKMPSPEGAKP